MKRFFIILMLMLLIGCIPRDKLFHEREADVVMNSDRTKIYYSVYSPPDHNNVAYIIIECYYSNAEECFAHAYFHEWDIKKLRFSNNKSYKKFGIYLYNIERDIEKRLELNESEFKRD